MARLANPYWLVAEIIVGVVLAVQGLMLNDGLEAVGGVLLIVFGLIYLGLRLSNSEEE